MPTILPPSDAAVPRDHDSHIGPSDHRENVPTRGNQPTEQRMDPPAASAFATPRTASPPAPTMGYTPAGSGWSVTITPRTLWLAMGIVLLTIGLVILLVKAIYVWILLFIAIVIAEGLRPLMNWLHERLHLPKPAAVLALLFGVIVLLLALVYLFISPFTAQISNLATNFPSFIARAQALIGHLSQVLGTSPQAQSVVDGLKSQAGSILGAVLPLLISIPVVIAQLVFSAIIVAVMVFFWMTGVEQLRPFILSLLPERVQPNAQRTIANMSLRVGGYLRGIVVNMFVIGILSGAGDYLLGAPYPLILGLVAGLMELLPYIGPWISGGVAILFAIIFADPLKAVEIIVFYIIIQEFEGNTLVPLVMMRTVKLNPLVVLVTVIVGGELLGIVGSILAVPFTAIVQVLIEEALVPAARLASTHITEPDHAHLATADQPAGPARHEPLGSPPPLPA